MYRPGVSGFCQCDPHNPVHSKYGAFCKLTYGGPGDFHTTRPPPKPLPPMPYSAGPSKPLSPAEFSRLLSIMSEINGGRR
jgi:hypothetical protein